MSAVIQPASKPDAGIHDDMILVSGGTFRRGSDRHYPEEAPVHHVTVGAFWMDRTPVTNREFLRFVNATRYVTSAEIRPEAKDYPGALPHMLRAGSLVFIPPGHAADRNYPPALRNTVGPRNMIHAWATDVDDPTVQPRWGKIGKQRIEDAGPLYPKRMETVDDEILEKTFAFLDKAKRDNKPFFLWLNPTRMHVITHLSEKYENMRTPQNGWGVEEAGMAQLDDIVGAVMQKLKDLSVDGSTLIVFTTDNGAENFTWPDGGQTPFSGSKGMALEGGFRVPCIVRWPGRVPPGKVENAIVSGLDWFPTFVAAAGNPNIGEELKAGKRLGGTTYKVHLDGYNQMDLMTGKGPSARREIFYFTESTLAAVRVDDFKYRFTDQPSGWLGGGTVRLDWPAITNLRLDPFERSGMPSGDRGSLAYYNFYVVQFWRFQFAQQVVEELGATAIEFPRMQRAASFNLESVKAQIEKAMHSQEGD